MKRMVPGVVGCAVLAALSLAAAPASAQEKPSVAVWGADISDVRERLAPLCTGGLAERHFSPAELPGVQDHRQIDCQGFLFMGGPRTAEFVFAENVAESAAQ